MDFVLKCNLSFKKRSLEDKFREEEAVAVKRTTQVLLVALAILIFGSFFFFWISDQFYIGEFLGAIVSYSLGYVLPARLKPRNALLFKFCSTVAHLIHGVWTVIFREKTVQYLVTYTILHSCITQYLAFFIFRNGRSAMLFSMINYCSYYGTLFFGLDNIILEDSPLDRYYNMFSLIFSLVSFLFMLRAIEVERRSRFLGQLASRNQSDSLRRLLEDAPVGILLCGFNFEVDFANKIGEELLARRESSAQETITFPDDASNITINFSDERECYRPRISTESVLHVFEDAKLMKNGNKPTEKGVPSLLSVIQEYKSDHQLTECQTQDLGEFQFEREDATMYFHVNLTIVEWEGQFRFFFLLKEVTEIQKMIERLQELNNLKTSWMRTVSHEFKTPLNGIIGSFDLLSEIVTEPAEQALVQTGSTAAGLLLTYISDLLDYFQIRTNKFSVNPVEFDVPAVMAKCVELVKFKLTDKTITLTTKIGENVPETIVNDKQRFQQIVLNLLSNAIKFTRRGGTIDVHVTKVDKWIQVEVSDNGIGIPEPERAKLFREFGKICEGPHAAMNPQGVGLGLWISKSLCQAMGGTLGVESKSDQGSTFSFTILECARVADSKTERSGNYGEHGVAVVDGDAREGRLPNQHQPSVLMSTLSKSTNRRSRLRNMSADASLSELSTRQVMYEQTPETIRQGELLGTRTATTGGTNPTEMFRKISTSRDRVNADTFSRPKKLLLVSMPTGLEESFEQREAFTTCQHILDQNAIEYDHASSWDQMISLVALCAEGKSAFSNYEMVIVDLLVMNSDLMHARKQVAKICRENAMITPAVIPVLDELQNDVSSVEFLRRPLQGDDMLDLLRRYQLFEGEKKSLTSAQELP